MFGYKYLNLDNKSYCARRNVRNDLWVMGQVKFSKHFCSQHHVQAGLIVLWWCWTLLAWFRNLLLWLWPCPVSALYTFLLLTRPGINNVIRHPPHMELIVPPSQHDSLTADTHPPFLRGVYLRKDPYQSYFISRNCHDVGHYLALLLLWHLVIFCERSPGYVTIMINEDKMRPELDYHFTVIFWWNAGLDINVCSAGCWASVNLNRASNHEDVDRMRVSFMPKKLNFPPSK